MSISNKDTALAIINFLENALSKNQVSEEYLDSINVAIECISDSFQVDKNHHESFINKKFSGKGLPELLALASFQQGQAPLHEDVDVPVTINNADDENEMKTRAEALKLEGNKAMTSRDFDTAIKKYSEAIDLTPQNAVYLSNRAAAYSSKGFHELAIKDAETAIAIDGTYAKAYSRLGLAKYALGDSKAALDAYKKGLENEGDKKSAAMQKGYETARRRVQEQLENTMGSSSNTDRSVSTDTTAQSSGAGGNAGGFPDLSNLASMFGGAGGAGAGGTPDFASMLSNPQIMKAAQQMMSNPNAMRDMMSNPAVAEMAKNFGGAGGAGGAGSGGMPDLSEMMNNPMLKNLANQFLGGQGGSGSGSGSNP